MKLDIRPVSYLALWMITVLLAPDAASAGMFTYSPIDLPGSPSVSAVGINNSGVVVGSVDFATAPTTEGYAFAGGNFDLFAVEAGGAALRSFANGINDAGVVVGGFDESSSSLRGFIRDESGVVSVMPNFSAQTVRTNPLAINASGQVVGAYADSTDPANWSGFVFDSASGTYTTFFRVPGAVRTQFSGINDEGLIVGRWQDASNNYHGFLYDGGVATTFDLPGFVQTHLFDINEAGQVVGYAQTGTGSGATSRGFLLENLADGIAGNEVLSFLDYPGTDGRGTRAYAINDRGQVAGTYDGFNRAFVATAVPEPSSAAMLAVGAASLVLQVVRRRVRSDSSKRARL